MMVTFAVLKTDPTALFFPRSISTHVHPEPRGRLQRRPATGVESSSSGQVAHENGAPSEELLTAKRANAMETVTVPSRLLWFWNCFPSPFPKLPPKYFASGKTPRNEK